MEEFLKINDEKYPPEDFCKKYCKDETFKLLSKLQLNSRILFKNDSKAMNYHQKIFQNERKKCDKCLATLAFDFIKNNKYDF